MTDDQENNFQYISVPILAFTSLVIVIVHIGYLYLKFNESILNIIFIWGFLGPLLLNIFVFVRTFFVGISTVDEILDDEKLSASEIEEKTEEVLAPVLQGEVVARGKGDFVVRVLMSIFVGMLLGSILGWLIRQTLERFL